MRRRTRLQRVRAASRRVSDAAFLSLPGLSRATAIRCRAAVRGPDRPPRSRGRAGGNLRCARGRPCGVVRGAARRPVDWPVSSSPRQAPGIPRRHPGARYAPAGGALAGPDLGCGEATAKANVARPRKSSAPTTTRCVWRGLPGWRPGAMLLVADVTNQPGADEKSRVDLPQSLIEHVDNDWAALQGCAACCVPDGICIPRWFSSTPDAFADVPVWSGRLSAGLGRPLRRARFDPRRSDDHTSRPRSCTAGLRVEALGRRFPRTFSGIGGGTSRAGIDFAGGDLGEECEDLLTDTT